ncbi:MAG: hypothetical protein M0027_05015 [Candidatus Dormibacteraeota bacterium]|nr:hypothetical protein [Candidatus Dormibacteraeota bacterium]
MRRSHPTFSHERRPHLHLTVVFVVRHGSAFLLHLVIEGSLLEPVRAPGLEQVGPVAVPPQPVGDDHRVQSARVLWTMGCRNRIKLGQDSVGVEVVAATATATTR